MNEWKQQQQQKQEIPRKYHAIFVLWVALTDGDQTEIVPTRTFVRIVAMLVGLFAVITPQGATRGKWTVLIISQRSVVRPTLCALWGILISCILPNDRSCKWNVSLVKMQPKEWTQSTSSLTLVEERGDTLFSVANENSRNHYCPINK